VEGNGCGCGLALYGNNERNQYFPQAKEFPVRRLSCVYRLGHVVFIPVTLLFLLLLLLLEAIGEPVSFYEGISNTLSELSNESCSVSSTLNLAKHGWCLSAVVWGLMAHMTSMARKISIPKS
jgi:hypothetical protein